MPSFSEKEILKALSTVIDPDLKKDLVSLNMIKDIKIDKNGDISFSVELTTPACPLKEKIEKDCFDAVKKETGSERIAIHMTSNVKASAGQNGVPGVKNIIAVASGKGGVGKSTVAANLAIALKQAGASVGLIDADVYGPSIPIMFNVQREKPSVENNKLIPVQKYGIKLMSIGFMVEPDQAVIWRGPMASSAIKQFINDTHWGDLDYLVVDLPPGTGDIQLTLVQSIPLTGSVIVTTPQNVALADAVKGISMFKNVKVPTLGVIENMAFHICSKCGNRDEIFSYGGGKKTADDLGVEFLGEIPLESKIRESGDLGTPITISEPDSHVAHSYTEIAGRLAQQIAILNESGESTKPVEIIFK